MAFGCSAFWIREAASRYLPIHSDPGNQVAKASRCLDDPCRRATSEPEGVEEAPTRRLDTLATSQEGLEKGAVRGRIAPLAVGGPLWVEWQERARVLEYDAGMDRGAAELQAAKDLGVFLDAPPEPLPLDLEP